MSGAGKMGDRGGGREGKKKSLNSIKKQKFKQEQNYFKDKQVTLEKPKFSVSPNPVNDKIDNEEENEEFIEFPIIDSGAHLMSRQFDRDLNAVIRRAKTRDVAAIIATLPDFSRGPELLSLIKQYPGTLYAMIGVSPDHVKKNQDRLFEQRMTDLADLALESQIVAIAAGLDLTREQGTHFLQQKLLTSQVELAIKIHLPVVFREKAAADKIIECVKSVKEQLLLSATSAASEEEWKFQFAIHGFSGSDSELLNYVSEGFFISINGIVCDIKVDKEKSSTPDADEIDSNSSMPELSGEGSVLFRQLRCGLIPIDRLLIASDSPNFTPQNITDVYERSQRNEPSNLPNVYKMVAKAVKKTEKEIIEKITSNSFNFFQLTKASAQPLATQQQQTAATNQSQSNQREEKPEHKDEPLINWSQAKSKISDIEKISTKIAKQKITEESEESDEEEESEEDDRDSEQSEDDDDEEKSGEDTEEEKPQQSTTAKTENSTTANSSAPRKRRKGGKSSGRHRVLGSLVADVNLGSNEDDGIIRYACKRCRNILFTANDLVDHAANSAAVVNENVANVKKSKLKNLASNDFTHCESLFLRPMKWMDNLVLPSSGTGTNNSSPVLVNNERVECPNCQAKLGRCNMMAIYLPCSCGRICSGPPPYFSIVQSRIDAILHMSEYRAPRSLIDKVEAIKTESQLESESLAKARKEAVKARKEKRKQKQQFDDVRGNFSEYRNQSQRKTKTKNKQGEEEEQQEK